MTRKHNTSKDVIRRMQTANGLVTNTLRDVKRTNDPRKAKSMTSNIRLLLASLQTDVQKLEECLEAEYGER